MAAFDHLLPNVSHFIDGKFVTGKGQKVPDIYPANGEAFVDIAWATDSEIEETRRTRLWRPRPHPR